MILRREIDWRTCRGRSPLGWLLGMAKRGSGRSFSCVLEVWAPPEMKPVSELPTRDQ